jgi:hypothetical protein
MGMDVMGHSPETETGEYFRANVWYWHPLWDYCMQVHPHLVGDNPEHGHYNDGYGLDAVSSKLLGEALGRDVAEGRARAYVDARNLELSKLERPTCIWCDGTGIRTDQIGVDAGMPDRELEVEMAILTGRTHGYCNGCRGEGKTDHNATLYVLDLETIDEFAQFLIDCGGFGIH